MHDRRRLARKIDPGLSEKSELFKIVVERIHAESLSHVDEYRIAGIHRALEECLRTMSADFMAADLPVFHDPESRTGKFIVQMDHSGLKSGSGCDDLKCGSRLIRIVDTAVPPHFVPRILKLCPCESAAFPAQ